MNLRMTTPQAVHRQTQTQIPNLTTVRLGQARRQETLGVDDRTLMTTTTAMMVGRGLASAADHAGSLAQMLMRRYRNPRDRYRL